MNTTMQRPSSVTAAFWIWLISALVGVGTIINVLIAVGFIATLTTDEDSSAWLAVETAGVIIAVLLAIGIVIQVVAAVKFRDGANWARIVLVVAAALSGAGVFFAPGDLVAWLFLVANVAALVLSFLPASNVFFAPHRRRNVPSELIDA